jgi:predicted nucleic acid-binding protein
LAFVLDASIAACRAFDDESDPRMYRAFARLESEEAFVPALWWFEIRNTLIVNERRSRLTSVATARSYRLTVYDAAYLELALRRNVDLATLDGDLAKAARAEGVAVV